MVGLQDYQKSSHFSSKIFLHFFWLAKIPSIIHQNQLLPTKLERILRYLKNDIKCAAKLPDYWRHWTVNWEDLRMRGWVVLVVSTKWQNISLQEEKIGELLAKNTARTARRQLDRQHLLFGEYLLNWTTLYLLNLLINMHYRR